MIMKYNVVIVGAGLAGSVSARILAESGYKVLVIEKERNVGGQCFDYKDEAGITIHKHGPHIFHTKMKHVWDFVNQYSEFSNYQHRVLSFANGNMVEFPINRNTIKDALGVELSNDQVNDFLKSEVQKSKFNNPPKSYRDAVISQVGERLYELFFEQYTKKQWKTDPENLSAELASRIPVRNNNDSRYFTDMYQGIPLGGYTKMVQNLLDHSGIHLLLGCNYFDVKESINSQLVVYTGELDRFFNFKYGKLTYKSVRIVLKTFDDVEFQPAPVVNYPNDYDWTRITEFKKLTGEKSPKTTVCFEYPSDEGHPFYTLPDKENTERRELYMNPMKELEEKNTHLFIGRLAEYKYYNMDQVIDIAIKKTQEWIKRQS